MNIEVKIMIKLLSIIDFIIITIGICLLIVNEYERKRVLDYIIDICLIVSGILTFIIQCV